MISSTFANQTITVTGGTGSFGSTMVSALLARGAEHVVVLSRDEAKQDEMRQRMAEPRLRFRLGDVRDFDTVCDAVAGADYVFHAAALKQVPSCEFFPDEALKTNVVGSQNVVEAAHRHGVRSVVCLSTDKAVYPVNAMGMSKGLMEKAVQAFCRNHPDSPTTVSITRYGNVMYSRGSVIPLFVKQLRAAKPLTVTEPGMTRYLMSLEESVDLVEHAMLNAQPGDLFVKKAAACTVETLARAVARVLGHGEPDIQRIGMRHGEKMFETLLTREERLRAVEQGDYFRVPLDARSLESCLSIDGGVRAHEDVVDYDSNTAPQMTVEETCELLLSLPEVRALLGARAA